MKARRIPGSAPHAERRIQQLLYVTRILHLLYARIAATGRRQPQLCAGSIACTRSPGGLAGPHAPPKPQAPQAFSGHLENQALLAAERQSPSHSFGTGSHGDAPYGCPPHLRGSFPEHAESFSARTSTCTLGRRIVAECFVLHSQDRHGLCMLSLASPGGLVVMTKLRSPHGLPEPVRRLLRLRPRRAFPWRRSLREAKGDHTLSIAELVQGSVRHDAAREAEDRIEFPLACADP